MSNRCSHALTLNGLMCLFKPSTYYGEIHHTEKTLNYVVFQIFCYMYTTQTHSASQELCSCDACCKSYKQANFFETVIECPKIAQNGNFFIALSPMCIFFRFIDFFKCSSRNMNMDMIHVWPTAFLILIIYLYLFCEAWNPQ